MHRNGHVGITLLCYTPVILLVGTRAEWLLPAAVVAAILLADLLFPVRLLVRAAAGRRSSVSFSPAMLPDLDMRFPLVTHRGITHTVWFAALAATVAGAIGYQAVRMVGPTRFPGVASPALLGAAFCGYLGLHAVLTHLLGDVLTPAGIRPFSPLVDTSFSLDLVRAANRPANLGLYAAGILSVAAATVVVI